MRSFSHLAPSQPPSARMEAPAPPAAQGAVLARICAGLRDADHIVRLQSATALQHFVLHTLPTLPPDIAARLWGETVNARLSELVFSQTSAAQLGGVLAIDYLLSAPAATAPLPLFRFYNYAKHLLPHPVTDVMLAASTTLGRTLAAGPAAFGARFVASEVAASITLLQEDAEAGRLAGVLVLTQLARACPEFGACVAEVLPHVLEVLRDPSAGVRTRAAELLGACCGVLVQRGPPESDVLLEVLRDAREGMAEPEPEPEVVHGSLLAYRELLLHGGTVIDSHVQDVVDAADRLKTHPDVHVREAADALMPVLIMHRTNGLMTLGSAAPEVSLD
ncbi:hypothetical protein PsYK624_049570 [Phanerochaete sordida]|uniref:ARM repeat-containing protein n=1 Tax=Phanerochaete sordida TaxID=48140 RepID=A0A9P3LB51_9APHY|nr:hypothetical protein PsYK624_049570 [Phanerochaete sordida]